MLSFRSTSLLPPLSPASLLPLLLLAAAAVGTNAIKVRKCCPPEMVFDVYGRCVIEESGEDLALRMGAEVCDGGDCLGDTDEDKLQLEWSGGQPYPCPAKAKREFKVIDFLSNGSLVIRTAGGRGVVEAPTNIEDGCVDMAQLPRMKMQAISLEGPFLQVCGFSSVGDGDPFVTKCCSRGDVIDPETEDCIEEGDALGDKAENWNSWIPPRLVRDAVTGSASSSFRLAHPDVPLRDLCGEGQKDRLRMDAGLTAVYTDGRVSAADRERPYSCVDRYIIRERGRSARLSQVVSFRCEQPKETRIGCTPEQKEAAERSGLVCVPKCCGPEEVYDQSEDRCAKRKEQGEAAAFSPAIYSAAFPHSALPPGPVFPVPGQLGLMRRDCTSGLVALHENNETLQILSDGSLHLTSADLAWPDDFCADEFVTSGGEDDDEVTVSGFKCHRSLREYRVTGVHAEGDFDIGEDGTLPCHGGRMRTFRERFRLTYTVCGVFSLIFLAATLHIYRTLPALRNLHGHIVIGNIVAVFLTTLCLVVLYNVRPGIRENNGQQSNGTVSASLDGEFTVYLSPVPCKLLGYSLYYVGVSMFCWMSAMCFDLGWTFARAKIPRRGSDKLKFRLYAAFACGFPAALLAWVAIDDTNLFGLQSKPSTLPEVGKSTCFLAVAGLPKYFYLPISVLLTFNMVMFVATVRSLWKTRQFARRAGLQRVSSARFRVNKQQENRRSSLRISFLHSKCDSKRPSINPSPMHQPLTQLGDDTDDANDLAKIDDVSRAEATVAAAAAEFADPDRANAPSDSSSTFPAAKKANSGGKPAAPASSSLASSATVRQEMILFVKIFFIMGLSWFSEVLHIGLHGDHSQMDVCDYRVEIFLRILGIINMLRGFFIFVVFICKGAIWRAVGETHPRLASFFRLWSRCLKRLSRRDSSRSGSNDGVDLAHGAGGSGGGGRLRGGRRGNGDGLLHAGGNGNSSRTGVAGTTSFRSEADGRTDLLTVEKCDVRFGSISGD